MPYYSFYIKKGKYQVEMTSDDIYFAKRQVDKLFEKLAKKQGKLRVVLPPIDPEKIKNEQKELKKINTVKEPTPEQEKPAAKTEKAVEIIRKTAQEKSAELKQQQIFSEEEEAVIEEVDKLLHEEIREKEEKAVIEEVDKLLHEELREKEEEAVIEEVDKLLHEEIREKEEKAVIEEADKLLHEELLTEEIIKEESVENLFENILAKKTLEINKNIEELKEEEKQQQPIKKTTGEKKKFSFKSITRDPLKASHHTEVSSGEKTEIKTSVKKEDDDEEIAKIIEEKIKKNLPKPEVETVIEDTALEQELESIEPDEPDVIYTELYEDDNLMTQDFETMEELIAIKKPQTKLDYLLLTAYYLQTKENLFKYSLKQLNSKSMPFLGSLIDHSIIHNAVAHDFIEVVPDYNGTAEVTEYRLTPVGEDYLLS